nr:glycosyltransferase [uncultured Methanoregula sp.]
MKRFALLSLGLPPSQSGQSMVLFHILKNIDPDKYCLITQKNLHLYSIKPTCSSRLPANYHYLHPDYQFIRMFIRAASMIGSRSMLNLALKVRTHQIKKIIRREHCDAIIACTGDLFDPPAAYIASRELGIPFIFYAFDYYSFQGEDPVLRSFAGIYESELVQAAAAVIVPNECMCAEYLKRYGISATILHNPFDLESYENQISVENRTPAVEKAEKEIVYTGAIYDAHYDAFRNLIAAIALPETIPVRIHLYTPQSPHHLLANNINGPRVVVHKAQQVTAMPAIQQNADILFLPLSFNPRFREIVKTSAPGKIGEYLASKRPVLVHAPKDSFVSWYFKKYHCGLVVDEDDPRELAKAINLLTTDEKLCQELTRNAYERAKTDFDAKSARKKLLALVDKITE